MTVLASEPDAAAVRLGAQQVEELLETIFTEREEGRDEADEILRRASPHAGAERAAALPELESAGLVKIDGRRVSLTSEGERRARDVVRRHRLTERLFHDLLELSEAATESQACEFEHILSPEATESVCTLLGHPPTCPHGKPIPRGPCCGVLQKTVRPLVTGLPNFELGTPARIVFIAPRFHDRMDKLAALGVIAGSEIRLHQRSPSYVIEVGETTIALDPEIAGEIFVRRAVP
jgi:DtxR family transcriptional regulator, Mn-dependent transcriptional regulator